MGIHHYLVVSDLHLADIEDHPDGWKRHKSSEWVFDDALEAMVDEHLSRVKEGDAFTFILNGDIFDFDLVTALPEDASARWRISADERRYGLAATPGKSRWKLERTLDDHPRFVAMLARLALSGHRVVVIAGNHDRELCFEEVAQALIDRVLASAVATTAATGSRLESDPGALAALKSRVIVEPWFYCVPGEIYVEHGHQYDLYSACEYNLDPTYERDGERHLALSTGNLSNRYLLSNIGFFNPHATDFILSGLGYLAHWLRHYAFTRRMLILTWLMGSLRALYALLRTRSTMARHPPRDYPGKVEATGARYGLAPGLATRLHALAAEPITSRFHKIVREYWIDRALLALLLTAGTIALALSSAALWVKLVVPLLAFPLAWFLYAWVAGADNALTTGYRTAEYARRIAALVPVRAIVFGHTHDAGLTPLSRETLLANSGTWAPSWMPDGRPVPGHQNFVSLAIDSSAGSDGDAGGYPGQAKVDVEVGSWLPLQPTPVRVPATSRDARGRVAVGERQTGGLPG